MVIFQGLSHNFWQITCARLGMSFGQSASEAVSTCDCAVGRPWPMLEASRLMTSALQIAVSLISDIAPLPFVPFFESFLYVGVYIGEAISSRISAIFKSTGTSWRVALKAIGIAGCVVAVVLRVVAREPERTYLASSPGCPKDVQSGLKGRTWRINLAHGVHQLRDAIRHAISLKSFWLITLSASLRQVSGNM